MMTFLLVASDKIVFSDFADALKKTHGVDLVQADTGVAALDRLSASSFDLVVADETLSDMRGIALIEKIVAANPLVNTALVSSLPGKDFHEATEGLGILAQLPPHPGPDQSSVLVQRLEQIRDLSAGIIPPKP